MVALRQKKIEEEEEREEGKRLKEKEVKEEKEKLEKLREKEVQSMRGWTEDKSWKYVERFRGYRRDMTCRKCGWFGHMAHYCRRMKIKVEREQRGWQPLRCRVIAYEEERKVACSERREAQQGVKCWGYGEEGYHL